MNQSNAPIKENYQDEEITFLLGIYKDLERAKIAITRLRVFYPNSRIIVRSDGDPNPENRNLVEQFQLEYYEEPRLYPIENGGEMMANMFELFLKQPTRFLLKLDTDSALYRRFNYLPEEKGLFGSVQSSVQKCLSIQGGFTGFTEETVRIIHDSKLLHDHRLKDPNSFREDSLYFQRMGNRVKRTNLCSFDWILGWVAYELELPFVLFPEVYCKWLPENAIRNDDLKFALSHPVYFEKTTEKARYPK